MNEGRVRDQRICRGGAARRRVAPVMKCRDVLVRKKFVQVLGDVLGIPRIAAEAENEDGI